MAMQRVNFPKELQEGLHAVFGMHYNKYPDEWRKVFDVQSTSKAFEEQTLRAGFGAAPIVPEGSATPEDEGAESWTARYTVVKVAMQFALTEEALEDGVYDNLGKAYSAELARAVKETKEILCADELNNGFDPAFPIGDGAAMMSAAHPLYDGPNQSNILAIPANLSESSLEDILIQINDTVNDRGLPVSINPVRLIIGTGNIFNATRILRSMQRVGTSDNDTNAIKALGIFQEDPHVMRRLTNTKAWFVKTDAMYGLQLFQHTSGLKRKTWVDETTGNFIMRARERYSPGITDWRGVFGSQGS